MKGRELDPRTFVVDELHAGSKLFLFVYIIIILILSKNMCGITTDIYFHIFFIKKHEQPLNVSPTSITYLYLPALT